VLNEAELKRALSVVAQGPHAARNRTALLLSHYGGLRVSEIAALTWQDVLDQNGQVLSQFYLRAETTKSNEARPVPIGSKLSKELRAYKSCVTQHSAAKGPVIASQKGRALLGQQPLSAVLASLCRSRSCRSILAQRQALVHHPAGPLRYLAQGHHGAGGHKSLATTQRYIDVNDNLLAVAVLG